MTVRWTATALADLSQLRNYIAEHDPVAAADRVARVFSAVERLDAYPASGRPGRVPHTRELVVSGTPFIVPYTVEGAELRVLAVLHAARKWPDRLP